LGKDLKLHFWNEENILFPLVKGKNNKVDELIEEILVEHSKIKNLIVELDTTENYETTLNDLGVLLEQHIRKEERQLFVQIENHFETELNEIEGKIVAAKDSPKN
jgi:iron-sulfur cluster repair protein YtfE (RIC family)